MFEAPTQWGLWKVDACKLIPTSGWGVCFYADYLFIERSRNLAKLDEQSRTCIQTYMYK